MWCICMCVCILHVYLVNYLALINLESLAVMAEQNHLLQTKRMCSEQDAENTSSSLSLSLPSCILTQSDILNHLIKERGQ